MEFKPDIILSDYNLPQLTGIDAIILTKKHSPKTPIIIVTGSISDEVAVACIKNGAWDYVLKEQLSRLEPAISAVLENVKRNEDKERAEDEREQFAIEIAEKNRQLEQIIYVSSHDLRTPLVNIQGYTGELRKIVENLDALVDSDLTCPELKAGIKSSFKDMQESFEYIGPSVLKMEALIK
jgi:DNA-binding NtrC family response regulator